MAVASKSTRKIRRKLRVVVLDSGLLFNEGLASLLRHEPDLRVSRVAYDCDGLFARKVGRARPDVIVLTEVSPIDTIRVFRLLKDMPSLADLRVIIVRSDDNTVEIYKRHSVSVVHHDNLLALIRQIKPDAGYKQMTC